MQVLSNFDTAATTSAVESLLLTPRKTANCAIAKSGGEQVLLRSSPKKSSPKTRKSLVRFANDTHAEKREEQPSTHQLAVDIQPRYDGTGIELIVNYENENQIEDKENEQASPYIRGSLLMVDPAVSAAENKEMLPMNLKVLQGKNLPFENTRMRIGVLNREGCEVDQILGTTPSSEGTSNPIWGSRICSWTLNANDSTQLVFMLLPENSSERKKKKKVPATISARVSVSDLLSKHNPNVWIEMKDENNPLGLENYGRIQVRLTRQARAKLHKQENCQKLTPGPAMGRMQSYAIRKMALYSCSPVILNVYDASKNRKVQRINNTTKSFGYGGIFHAGIEIQGREYSFGGTVNKDSKFTGVFQCAPKQCPMHHYRESVFLGDCELNSQQVEDILKGLRPKWMAKSYNLFRKNCALFSRELAIELGVGDIPEWVFSLATTTESIEPYLNKINHYLKNQTNSTIPKSAVKRLTSFIPARDKMPAKKKVPIDSHEEIQAHEVAKNTQAALLDHAMAARIQRAFRAFSARREKTIRNLQVPMVASA